MRLRTRLSRVGTLVLVLLPAGLGALSLDDPAAAREREEGAHVRTAPPVGGVTIQGAATGVVRSATVNFMELGRMERSGLGPKPPVRAIVRNELEGEPAEPAIPPGPDALAAPPPFVPFVASPSPIASFIGMDDIPMVDSSYIVIPPDVSGAVGPASTLEGLNNNYLVQSKSNGSALATVGTATFWDPVVTNKTLLNQLTDPRTLYDPTQNRWIVETQTVNTNGLILIGVSQTSDPAGNWFLYSFGNLTASPYVIDFPNLGFNKNWIAVAINVYNTSGAFQRGITLVLNYAQARAGTLPAATVFTQASATHFYSSPCATYSATEDTLFVVTHLNSGSATYEVDAITGTPAAPAYTTGGALTRPGGGWAQPGGSGAKLPQSAPISGASVCTPPCPIEPQDSQVRSAPVYRGGFIYYAQTVGLPASTYTHTAVQWTEITPSTTAAFVDGGRIEDATATSTNGGKWYAYPHIAVNGVGDFVVGYTQCSSAQHPSAGYSYHDHADGAGTIRDPLIYKAGDDYYHKDFGKGRNRWGDFSQCSVDPSDDRSFWVLQEYARTRANTDDGTTGNNGSWWGTWWAKVVGPNPVIFTVAASAGPGGTIGPSGNVRVSQGGSQSFTITPGSCRHVADVLVDGSSVGAVTGYTFTNVQANHTIAASFALNGPFQLSASAGAGGAISPSGSIAAACGDTVLFTISPDNCHVIANVLVDGGSVGAVSSYRFSGVQANHTIAASFSSSNLALASTHVNAACTFVHDGTINLTVSGGIPAFTYAWSNGATTEDLSGLAAGVYTVTVRDSRGCQASRSDTVGLYPRTIVATAAANGSIAPAGNVNVGCGTNATFTITPNSGYAIDRLVVDGERVVSTPSYTFSGVTVGHTISATFKIRLAAVESIPAEFALGRVIPNPMQGSMRVEYGLPEESAVHLSVVDVQGREIAVLAEGVQAAGWHPAGWSGRAARGRAPAGLYFARLRAGGRTFVQRFVLTR
ncbi:MAG: T9SS type A sorting domain-containing protein [Candidatus Eisenbacteria bacterium]|uniref:T9SS type A sorting domain-containing protein n=1 Tax=Eiseniibacteriota bacterium TaxID=2212470 RepID=A0A538SX06_UNCEI|nr:MAG: T9SS type A sorting domain-containing protein [Candidatus Eisenbacteria bacterium]